MKYFFLIIFSFTISFANPLGDDDRDLVPNESDLCPDTVVGVFVDNVGCIKIIEKKIVFPHGKAIFHMNQSFIMDEVVALAKELQGYKIYIQGHADSTSTSMVNLNLSKKRAMNIYNTLSKHIDTKRIIVSWYGEAQPIASNTTEEGRAQNRRVSIEFR